MADRVFRCPLCEATGTAEGRVLICQDCHVFMRRVIDDGAFEKIDPDDPPKRARSKKDGS